MTRQEREWVWRALEAKRQLGVADGIIRAAESLDREGRIEGRLVQTLSEERLVQTLSTQLLEEGLRERERAEKLSGAADLGVWEKKNADVLS